MKRVLMIAFHFPPLAGSSGVQRTLRFVQHLPSFGWQPLVLTAMPGAYERTSDDLLRDVPDGVIVRRALALDAARQLSVRGRYLGVLARPDRWMTWQYDARRVGAAMIRDFAPQAIWSTYPLPTAHLIATRLHARFRVPWVADFRDPMAQPGYPADPRTWAQFKDIEQHALATAAASVFTTPGAAAEYRRRYPPAAGRVQLIENGYDEESFGDSGAEAARLGPLRPGALTLLHSGIVYPSERDPTCLFDALGRCKRDGRIDAPRLRVRFRASVHDDLLRTLAARFNVADLVEIEPPIDYREALVEMQRADGLLLLQASNCNEQIPAKLYEYLRARRPVLVLSDSVGDTAQAAAAAGITRQARLDDSADIATLLSSFVADPARGAGWRATEAAIDSASRRGRARQLAVLLDSV